MKKALIVLALVAMVGGIALAWDGERSDLDKNGTVGLTDLVVLANAYGSEEGDANWNAAADIDGNGVVGLTDLVTLAYDYGKTEPK